MSQMYKIATFYRFFSFPDCQRQRESLLRFCRGNGLRGTILMATEGINGTVCGHPCHVDALLDWLRDRFELPELEAKYSYADVIPFLRMKVKVKPEIVSLGAGDLDVANTTGYKVAPEDWDALIAREDVLLIDTRNTYETQIGQFKGACDPKTEDFRSFPDYVEQHLQQHRDKKIAMYCTGGIRCEKASSYLRQQGFDEVYQLDGGILNYLALPPERKKSWLGECFVFDARVAVDRNLQPGQYQMCHACRMPLTSDDVGHEHYQAGVSCHHCFHVTTPEKKSACLERARQVDLAASRGEVHLG